MVQTQTALSPHQLPDVGLPETVWSPVSPVCPAAAQETATCTGDLPERWQAQRQTSILAKIGQCVKECLTVNRPGWTGQHGPLETLRLLVVQTQDLAGQHNQPARSGRAAA